MNQERIGQLIKDLRLKDGLSQKEFASKYNVTYQAVSKWENGINMPDIEIIKKICDDYDISIDEFINAKVNKKKNINRYLVIVVLVILVFCGYLLINRPRSFEFKTLSSECSIFNISGNIAYNSASKAIYISNIIYCKGEDNKDYKSIECSLNERKDDISRVIDSISYKDDETIKLEEFLKDVSFSIYDFDSLCDEYNDDSLYLDIEAIDIDDNRINYRIPLILETCEVRK